MNQTPTPTPPPTGENTHEGMAPNGGGGGTERGAGLGRLVGLEQEEVGERAAQWCSSFKPCNPFENWLVDRIALESIRVERCAGQEMAMRAHLGERAKLLWDDDRRVEVAQLALGMAKNPELTRLRLEMTTHGCDWLIERWEVLRPVAERGERWSEGQRRLASDLLGGAQASRDRALRVDGDAPMQAELARGEIARLTTRKAGAIARVEAQARALAEVGIGPEVDRQLRALRRYETSCLRRLEWAFAQFKKGRHAYRPDLDPGPGSHPDPDFDRDPARSGHRDDPRPFGGPGADAFDFDRPLGSGFEGAWAEAGVEPLRLVAATTPIARARTQGNPNRRADGPARTLGPSGLRGRTRLLGR